MANYGNLFTKDEDEIIRIGYMRQLTLTQIAKKIGRSIASTGSRAQLLGLHHHNGTRNQKAKIGRFAMMQYVPLDKPTLAYIPGIVVTENSKYQMRPA